MQKIPQRLDAAKQVAAALRYDGYVDLSRLSRLDDLLAEQQGEVKVSLNFDQDEQNIAVLWGSIEAEPKLICQRCHKPDVFFINTTFSFALIQKEEDAEHLPEIYEPLLLSTPEINVFELIEEELILALPIVHFHAEGHPDCSESIEGASFRDKDAGTAEKQNPFSVLETLKLKS